MARQSRLAASMIILCILQPDKEGVTEVAVSGVIIISGIVFFKADGVVPFAHAIWHCFVSAAAGYHYFAVIKYLYQAKVFFEASHEGTPPEHLNL